MLTQRTASLGSRQAPHSHMLSHMEGTAHVQLVEEKKRGVPGEGTERPPPLGAASPAPFRAPAPRAGLGHAPPGSDMTPVCPSTPDPVSRGLELSEPFPAGS